MDEKEKQPEAQKAPIESHEAEISKLQESLKECQDKYLRALAESENGRKRMQKERQEMVQRAVEDVLVEFLHPIDSLEKALSFAQSMSSEVKNWAIGFEMILNQFKHLLSQHGAEDYHSVGKPFNTHFHEAVETVETTEYDPGIVVEEFTRGYKIGNRPIRVARVKVAKAPPQKENLQDKPNEESK